MNSNRQVQRFSLLLCGHFLGEGGGLVSLELTTSLQRLFGIPSSDSKVARSSGPDRGAEPSGSTVPCCTYSVAPEETPRSRFQTLCVPTLLPSPGSIHEFLRPTPELVMTVKARIFYTTEHSPVDRDRGDRMIWVRWIQGTGRIV